ncbi:TetR/AcrR family transcriptional regulator [Micromonospora sp. NBC_01405]|uniref:TetR/AcrR family transcriptional regulator n=1 Tax=Micromonospora sp. NBC_01405 TaxID=2903589 RepID=UPI003247BAF0
MLAADPQLPSRRDAQRNRHLLIQHARAAFAEQGMDAPLEQIARNAGLAIGTLYRHFPSRIDLLVAAFEPKLQKFLEDAEAALVMADPWDGFCAFLDALCSAQAGDRGFNEFVSQRFPSDERTEALHNRLCQLAERILCQAQVAGVVRPDITNTDIIALFWASSKITEATHHIAPQTWRRHLHLVIDGFRADNRRQLPEPPLSAEQLYRAMAHLNE